MGLSYLPLPPSAQPPISQAHTQRATASFKMHLNWNSPFTITGFYSGYQTPLLVGQPSPDPRTHLRGNLPPTGVTRWSRLLLQRWPLAAAGQAFLSLNLLAIEKSSPTLAMKFTFLHYPHWLPLTHMDSAVSAITPTV